MKPLRGLIRIAVSALLIASGACAGFPSLTLPSWSATHPPVQEISRCGVIPTAYCLVSFGVDNTNQMLISFLVPPGSSSGFYLKVQNNGLTTQYSCQIPKDFPSSLYCTGEQIPLGASITIELYSATGNALLAQGSFVINALAIPTPISVVVTNGTGGISTPLTPVPTRAVTRTPSTTPRPTSPVSPTVTGAPRPTSVSTATPTPTPINPYANPYRNP